MKLALHRSIIFWSGLLVVVFICWAWWDSFSRLAGVEYDRSRVICAEGGVALWHSPSSLDLAPNLFYESLNLRHPGWEAIQSPCVFSNHRHEAADYVPFEALEVAKNAAEFNSMRIQAWPPGSFGVFIPHWLILLAVVLPWAALLLWRSKRRLRA